MLFIDIDNLQYQVSVTKGNNATQTYKILYINRSQK